MDIWQKAKNLAEEAAKRTQTLTTSTRIADIVSETAKRSKEFAAEAKSLADHRIKSLTDQIPSITLLNASSPFSDDPIPPLDLEKFGITDDLRQFARGFTVTTFQNFPIHDDSIIVSDVPTVSNVRQDLTDWQQKHASLVLITVKEISRLRYELCPRHMKDGQFWRIYFTLVSSHVAPYEKQYNDEEIQAKEAKAQRAEQSDTIEEGVKSGGGTSVNKKSLRSTSSTADEDLDSFLLGDIDDAADGEDNFNDDDDDFDKIDSLDAEDDRI